MPQCTPDFDIKALYAAIDSQRRARGLTWDRVAQEMSDSFEHVPAEPISPTALSGMRMRRYLEADGVLQMLRWLHRSPESFIPGHESAPEAGAFPPIDRNRIVRFDTVAMHASLDEQRKARRMTWAEVAEEIGDCQPAALTRLARGRRTTFPHVMRITRWLDRPAASFMHSADR